MKKKSPLTRPALGYTLIELLVVMAIIATLAALGIGMFTKTQQMKREKQTLADLNLLANGIQAYHSDYGIYPDGSDPDDSTSSPNMVANGVGNTEKLYKALYGDLDGDGEPDTGKTVYVDGLSPLTNSRKMIETTGTTHTIVDGWGNQLLYRLGTTSGNNTADNPDFDLWSTGKDSAAGEDHDDIILK